MPEHPRKQYLAVQNIACHDQHATCPESHSVPQTPKIDLPPALAEQALSQALTHRSAKPDVDPQGLLAEVVKAFPALTSNQQDWLMAAVRQFQRPHTFWRHPESDWITEKVLQGLGDGLRLHHAFSRQSLTKDKFEFAFEAALKRGGFTAELTKSRTNPGRDILILFSSVEALKSLKNSSMIRT